MGKMYKKSSSKIGWIVFLLGIVFALFYFLNPGHTTSPQPPKTTTNRDIALSCTTDMATQFHVHVHLEISIKGEKQEIPANIGINGLCMNPLHTHDNSGTIHIESPERRDFTLSDFFVVWNKTFNKDQILDVKIDEHYMIRETVNDKEVKEYEHIILHDKDQISIFYEEKK